MGEVLALTNTGAGYGIRKQFHWLVKLVNPETGQEIAEDVHAYWDPNKEGTLEGIGNADRLQANIKHKKPFAVVGIPELVK